MENDEGDVEEVKKMGKVGSKRSKWGDGRGSLFIWLLFFWGVMEFGEFADDEYSVVKRGLLLLGMYGVGTLFLIVLKYSDRVLIEQEKKKTWWVFGKSGSVRASDDE